MTTVAFQSKIKTTRGVEEKFSFTLHLSFLHNSNLYSPNEGSNIKKKEDRHKNDNIKSEFATTSVRACYALNMSFTSNLY